MQVLFSFKLAAAANLKGGICLKVEQAMPITGFYAPTFLAGGSVAAAGSMYLKGGVVYFVSNYTGHYRVPFEMLTQVREELKKNG